MSSRRDFEAERAALMKQLDGEHRWSAVFNLQALEEAWARWAIGGRASASLVALARRACETGISDDKAALAIEHLERAEHWQRQIASTATGGGEGLAYMAQVNELLLARAWTLIAARKKSAARKLYSEAARRSDQLGRALKKELAALEQALG